MKKRKLNTKKLATCLFITVISIYLLSCSISYSIKIMEKARQYEPKERTIIVK